MPALDVPLKLLRRKVPELLRMRLLQPVHERQVRHRRRANRDVAAHGQRRGCRRDDLVHGNGNARFVTPPHCVPPSIATIPVGSVAVIATPLPVNSPNSVMSISADSGVGWPTSPLLRYSVTALPSNTTTVSGCNPVAFTARSNVSVSSNVPTSHDADTSTGPVTGGGDTSVVRVLGR